MTELLRRWAFRVMASRPPDFVVGGDVPGEPPYLNRWYAVPRNCLFNVYVHEFLRSDDNRALHDHPWIWNLSVLVCGAYREHTIARGGINRWVLRRAGTLSGLKFRLPWAPHRVELLRHPQTLKRNILDLYRNPELPVYTIFLTGFKIRRWGFHCRLGWRDFELFVKKTPDGNGIGGGCGELE